MLYFIKTPKWVQKLYPKRLWRIDTQKPIIYLTFDDGPHPTHTTFVLDELKKHNAKASFFCIGNNVKMYPDVYRRILYEGHSVGNHTNSHLKGTVTEDNTYIHDISDAAKYIDSNLFRPPYGRIKSFQEKILTTKTNPFKIVMWTVLSGDFDISISKERCLENVLFKTENGSIVVFHDSDKAAERMKYALPIMLKSFTEKGFTFEKI